MRDMKEQGDGEGRRPGERWEWMKWEGDKGRYRKMEEEGGGKWMKRERTEGKGGRERE